MQSSHLEKIFYHYLETRPEIEDTVNIRFYDTPEIRLAHQIRSEFRKKFSQAPTQSQLIQLVKVKGLEEELSPGKIEALYDIKLGEYDPDWMQTTTEAWIEYKTLDSSVIDLVSYLKTTQITAENVKDVVQTAKSIISERNTVDFKFDEGSDFFNPASHKQTHVKRFSTGYPYLDNVMKGGYRAKTLLCFAGVAKVGKSLWLGNLAAQAIRESYNVAYISLEMPESEVTQRLACNLLNITGDEYVKVASDEMYIKNKLKSLHMMDSFATPGNLLVKEFPTSTASTIDVENYLKRVEERRGIKFHVVFVDYIGIMKNWRNPNTENSYQKLKQIAEDLRAAAMRNEWCIVTASQFNRGAYGSSDVLMEQISESAALVHTVDGLFGIIQDEIMYMNSEYYLKVLANRSGGLKNAKKRFMVSFDYMRISEDLNSTVIESIA